MSFSQKEGVSIVTLGCPKNIADSGHLRERLIEEGISVLDSPDRAAFIVVNTCGFIEDAKRESIEEILRLATVKKNGTEIIAMGCLVKRYREELVKELPEVSAFFGLNEEEKVVHHIKNRLRARGLHINKTPQPSTLSTRPEVQSSFHAYIKISDGCRRKCSFCAIPAIKGPYRSIEPQRILKEAEKLISLGVKELILVGQEISSYGIDKPGFPSLKELLREISSISGDFWIRLLYLHPSSIKEDLLEEIASNNKVCKYLDIPLQHSENKILRLMKRPGSKEIYKKIIKNIRETIEGVTLRTTFIVGFPQETEKDFRGLLDFIREMEFERLGAFKYSREEGTPAFHLKGQVPNSIKDKRYNELMKLQAGISLKKNLSLIGKRMKALIEEVKGNRGFGRLQSQAPEIDGMVIIKGDNLKPGTFRDVIIKRAYDYDLEAEI